ncbi:MAG TPA: hypothetical protein PLQ28_06495, partial [Flexilinea sp.]|nr:hypothetical protein [Flexilinea sp.]
MKTPFRKLKTVIVPIGRDGSGEAALSLAKTIANEVILVGVVSVYNGESISAGTGAARSLRKRLLELSDGPKIRFKSTIIVSDSPWKDLLDVISDEKPQSVLIEWKDDSLTEGLPVNEVLSNSLVNVLIFRSDLPIHYERTMVAVRGGPHAELALKVAMTLKPNHLDVLHISRS